MLMIKVNLAFKYINQLSAQLNPICHLLTLLGAHHILHVSRVRVKACTETVFPTHFNGKLNCTVKQEAEDTWAYMAIIHLLYVGRVHPFIGHKGP
jgi:hypothetical protein